MKAIGIHEIDLNEIKIYEIDLNKKYIFQFIGELSVPEQELIRKTVGDWLKDDKSPVMFIDKSIKLEKVGN